MGKLNIALAITDLDVGGAERCLVDLAVRTNRNQFEPVVYCLGTRPPKDEESCVPALEAAGVDIRFLDARANWQLPGLLRRFARLLRQQKADLVQSFLFHANLAGRLAGRWAGVLRVVSGIRVAEQHSRWHLRLDRLTSRMVDRYVCVSQAVARFTAQQGGIPPAKLTVIPNGIDTTRYPANRAADLSNLSIAPGRRLVVFIGRLEPQKGVRWLVETAPRWLAQMPDCDILLVGKGPQEAELRQLCANLGITDRVYFAGWRSDVAEILAASTLLVLPSRWEGMPNVVLQAMASGRPVVATDVEGVRELLGEDANPQVVRYGDSESLAAAILRMLALPLEASELGRRNRTRVEAEFTIERMVAAYQGLWESLSGA